MKKTRFALAGKKPKSPTTISEIQDILEHLSNCELVETFKSNHVHYVIAKSGRIKAVFDVSCHNYECWSEIDIIDDLKESIVENGWTNRELKTLIKNVTELTEFLKIEYEKHKNDVIT